MNATLFREFAVDFSEKETLNHILSFTRVKDPEQVTENLIDSFGSLKGIIEARPEQLKQIKGITEKTAEFISSFLPMFKVYQNALREDKEAIRNCREAENFCLSLLQGCRNEKFYVISLTAKCDVIGKRMISEGTLSEVSAYPRMVVETALNYNAHSVLLCHNHPGGTCAPSPEDVNSTIQIQKILNELGILVLDHIIIANDRTYSMIQHGDITYHYRGR